MKCSFKSVRQDSNLRPQNPFCKDFVAGSEIIVTTFVNFWPPIVYMKCSFKSVRQDLNLGPIVYKTIALPTELRTDLKLHVHTN